MLFHMRRSRRQESVCSVATEIDLIFTTCFSALADDHVEHAVVCACACALTKSNCLTEEWGVTSTLLHRRNAVADKRWRKFEMAVIQVYGETRRKGETPRAKEAAR